MILYYHKSQNQLEKGASHMKIGIGIDTGGTYTDAVLYDLEAGKILAKSKALTTPHALTEGICEALDALPLLQYPEITVVALSTTLATNACVENKGGRAKLVCMGLYPKVVNELGKNYGLPDSSEIFFYDTHGTFSGEILEEPDWQDFLEKSHQYLDDADSIGVVEIYAMNNGGVLERKAKAQLENEYGVEVIPSNDLFTDLNSLQRGSSTLLNARLVPIIRSFLKAIHHSLDQKGIHAKTVIMRSDASIMSEEFTETHPVETLVCGPAASVMGGLALTGETEGVVVDMGGTTTDIALVKDSIPIQSKDGVQIGGWKTFVKGLAIDTFGLGGDTAVRYNRNDALEIQQQRILPICVLADRHPEIIPKLRDLAAMDKPHTKFLHEFFVLVHDISQDSGYTPQEKRFCEQLRAGPLIFSEAAECYGTDVYNLKTDRLEKEGVVLRAGLTPTDIMHLKGDFTRYNREAAEYAAKFVACCTDRSVEKLCDDVYRMVKKRIYTNIIKILLRNEFPGQLDDCEDKGLDFLIEQSWKRAVHGDSPSFIHFGFQAVPPLIGIGAPIHIFLPDVARYLGTTCLIPKDAEVANAIGALAGRVSVICEAQVKLRESQSGEQLYFVHARDMTLTAEEKEDAISIAKEACERYAREEALRRGAGEDLQIICTVTDNTIMAKKQIEITLDTTVRCVAIGKPMY